MTTIAQPGRTTPTRSRRRPLAQSISVLRARRVNISLESLFLTVGALCLPIGVIVILLGWYGASHTGHLYEQNDYLISGGLLGLGLIFIGGFLYFGYWMTRQIRATETGSQQTLRALARLEEKLDGTATGSAPSATGVFVVTEHGSMLHRPSCPAVADKSVRILDRPDTTRYRPCTICMPAD
ncbi:MAG TPA: hypothetical protein VE991_03145 [Acidimicrobiales bacterium]|nr:hypothetical protein [Acidimicrobiales bacterium]